MYTRPNSSLWHSVIKVVPGTVGLCFLPKKPATVILGRCRARRSKINDTLRKRLTCVYRCIMQLHRFAQVAHEDETPSSKSKVSITTKVAASTESKRVAGFLSSRMRPDWVAPVGLPWHYSIVIMHALKILFRGAYKMREFVTPLFYLSFLAVVCRGESDRDRHPRFGGSGEVRIYPFLFSPKYPELWKGTSANQTTLLP